MDEFPRLESEWLSTNPRWIDLMGMFFLALLTALLAVYPPRTPHGIEMKKYFSLAGITTAILQFLNSFYLYRAYPGMAALWLKLHILVTALCGFFLFRFSEAVFDRNKNRAVYWVTLATVIIAIFSPAWGLSLQAIRNLGYLFTLWGIPSVVYGSFLVWIAARNLKAQGLALLPYAGGAGLLVLLGGWDLLQLSLGRLPVSIPASGIGFLIAIVMGAITLILRDNEEIIGKLITDANHWKTQHDLANSMIQIEKEAEIGRIAAQVAHDIRSPLAALENIMTKISALPEDDRILIRTAVNRIKDIANTLIQKNREMYRKSPTQGIQGATHGVSTNEPCSVLLISSALDPLISEKRMQFRPKMGIDIDLQLNLGSYGLFAAVQPTEFKRVLSNLINNAVEALIDHGKVTVFLDGMDDQIRIGIADTGKGIPTEILAKLGRRGETHGKAGGSGLGLYHAKTSIENWGGRLDIKSKVSEGTSILISLPKATPPSWFVSSLDLKPMSVVVILDDDLSIHRVWQGRLESAGAGEQGLGIRSFTSAEELTQWVKSDPTATASHYLVDYELRGQKVTGVELIQALNLQSQSILVTSRFEEKSIKEACARLKIRVIPKSLASFVPIHIS